MPLNKETLPSKIKSQHLYNQNLNSNGSKIKKEIATFLLSKLKLRHLYNPKKLQQLCYQN